MFTEGFTVIASVNDHCPSTAFRRSEVTDDGRDMTVFLVNRIEVIVEEVGVVPRRFARGSRLERLRTLRLHVVWVVHIRKLNHRQERFLQLTDVLVNVRRQQVLRRSHIQVTGRLQVGGTHELAHAQISDP